MSKNYICHFMSGTSILFGQPYSPSYRTSLISYHTPFVPRNRFWQLFKCCKFRLIFSSRKLFLQGAEKIAWNKEAYKDASGYTCYKFQHTENNSQYKNDDFFEKSTICWKKRADEIDVRKRPNRGSNVLQDCIIDCVTASLGEAPFGNCEGLREKESGFHLP